MKSKYMLLFMMISGSRQPENDIDVYLSPLIEYLRVLWKQGIDQSTYINQSKKNSYLRKVLHIATMMMSLPIELVYDKSWL